MKKIFTKLIGVTLGLAMAVGVGVGVAANNRAATGLNATDDSIDLTTVTCDANPTDDLMTWTRSQFTIQVAKGSGTKVTNYYPGTPNQTYDYTRFYTGNVLTVTPASGYQIDAFSISCTGTGTTYTKFAQTTNCTVTCANATVSAVPTVKTNPFVMTGNGTGRYTAFNISYSVATSTPEIQLDKAAIEVGVGEDATFTVSTAHLTSNFSIAGGNDTYFTTNYTPASNDGDHTVTLHGVSETVSPITLTVSATGATSKTIDVSVIQPVVYEKVVSNSSLKDGREFIIGSADGNYVLGQYSGSGNNCPALASTPNASGNLVESNLPSGYALFTISGDSNGWTLTDQDSKIYYGTVDQNYLKSSNNSTDTWTISVTAQGVATLTSAASSRSIKKNGSNALFSTYANGQADVSIYMIPSTEPEIQVDVTGSTSLGVGETATLTVTKLNGATGTVNWGTSNSSILSLSASTGDEVTVTAGSVLGTATITASLAGCDDVVTSFKVRKGSVTLPYTVAEAKEVIDGSDPLAKAAVCVTGYVSQVVKLNDDKSMTYWINDDGSATNQFEIYKGKSFGGADFESVNDIEVGAIVKVAGNLTKYNTTYEFEEGSELVAYAQTFNITFESNGGSSVASQKIADGGKVAEPANPTRASDENNSYVFVEWHKESDFSDEAYDFDSIVHESFTLYAKWNAIPLPAYQIIGSTLNTESSLSYSNYSKQTSNVTKTDTLNCASTGRSGTSYGNWECNGNDSGVTYKGNSAAGNDSIQLRSSDNSGIVVTANNNYFVKKITVTWNDATPDGRKLDVYGKNSAYDAASDLYNNAKKGTGFDSITLDKSSEPYTTSIDVAEVNQFAFIGIKSNANAHWIDSIEIQWGVKPTYTYENLKVRFAGKVSQSLWERLDSESHIEGYGMLLTTAENLGNGELKDSYNSAVEYTSSPDVTTTVVKFSNTKAAPNLSNGYYGWSLHKSIAAEDLATSYVAVAYIVTRDNGVVFLEEIEASASSLAKKLIDESVYEEDAFGGSLKYLADQQ